MADGGGDAAEDWALIADGGNFRKVRAFLLGREIRWFE